MFYIFKKDDPVDKKLADFINSLNDPDRVKVMFIREGQGVYQFGTKKVFVKIDQEKIFSKDILNFCLKLTNNLVKFVLEVDSFQLKIFCRFILL